MRRFKESVTVCIVVNPPFDERTFEGRWRKLCADVSSAMREYAMPYTTPISHAITNDDGALQGTGAYIESDGKRFLVTNEHVLRHADNMQFAHQFFACDDVYKLSAPFAAEPPPVDTAICAIDKSWVHNAHGAQALPLSHIAKEHSPVQRELLFFIGYSQGRSTFHFGTFVAPGTPLLTQEPIPPPEEAGDTHFALSYKPDFTESVDGSSRPLPLPPGMSGSIVWNTRWVECWAQGTRWTPDQAIVTGMLSNWPTNRPYVFAIRSEVLLRFIEKHL